MQKIKQDICIGNNIRALRNAAHMTQEDVVIQLQLAGYGISRSIYAQMEVGTYNIRVSELAALKRIFHTDYNAFFEGVEEELFGK